MIGVHDPAAANKWRPFAGHGRYLCEIACGRDAARGQTLLASVGDEGTVRVWDFPAGTLRRAIQVGPVCLWAVAFSPDGRTLAVGGQDNCVNLIDLDSGWIVARLACEVWVRWLGFNPDGQSLAVGGGSSLANRNVSVWGLAPIARSRAFENSLTILDAGWRPDGRTLVTAGMESGRLDVRDPTLPAPTLSIPAVPPMPKWKPGGPLLGGMALTPEGRYAVTANPDGTVSVVRLPDRPGPSPPP